MKLTLKRFFQASDATIGGLFLDEEFQCLTLEDIARPEKVYGKTRIPSGTYKVIIRTWGKWHESFLKKFPKFHKGMLQLMEVPNYSDILIHTGNREEHTEGCILVGRDYVNSEIANSTLAYQALYPKVVKAALNKQLEIEVIDELP